MNANAIRKPNAPQVRELGTNEIDAVSGAAVRYVRMLQNWWILGGPDGPVKIGPA